MLEPCSYNQVSGHVFRCRKAKSAGHCTRLCRSQAENQDQDSPFPFHFPIEMLYYDATICGVLHSSVKSSCFHHLYLQSILNPPKHVPPTSGPLLRHQTKPQPTGAPQNSKIKMSLPPQCLDKGTRYLQPPSLSP